MPGPICYGRDGAEITVTDANLFLGRLSARHFLGGGFELDPDPVAAAMNGLADDMGMSPLKLAEGVVSVANTTMAGAIRVISVERGFDPRDFSLLSFGGAGSMHAAALAADLGIPRVIVPPAAGILSALGMLLADIARDYSQTVMHATEGLDPQVLEAEFARMEVAALAEFELDGVAPSDLTMERSLDVRYAGQGYELEVPAGVDFAATFHTHHQRRYGYSDSGRATEIVNARLRVAAPTDKPSIPSRELQGSDASAAVIDRHVMVFDGQRHDAALIDRELLCPGNVVRGPALVAEYSTTTVVPPGVRGEIDGFGNLVMEITK